MAASPVYAVVPRLGFAAISTANTARDGSGTIVDALTAAAAGTRIEKIRLKATDNPANSVVTMFIHDGTAYRLYDEFDIGDPAAASTTDPGGSWEKPYSLVLPSASYKIAFAITVALTAGVINAFVEGIDLT